MTMQYLIIGVFVLAVVAIVAFSILNHSNSHQMQEPQKQNRNVVRSNKQGNLNYSEHIRKSKKSKKPQEDFSPSGRDEPPHLSFDDEEKKKREEEQISIAVRTTKITMADITDRLQKTVENYLSGNSKVEKINLSQCGNKLVRCNIGGDFERIHMLAKKHAVQFTVFKDGSEYLCFFKAKIFAQIENLIIALGKEQLKELKEPFEKKIARAKENQNTQPYIDFYYERSKEENELER